MHPIYTVIFNDVNYYEHVMTEERSTTEKLKLSLRKSLQEQWGLNGLDIKYSCDMDTM